jgi:hypothetical protein
MQSSKLTVYTNLHAPIRCYYERKIKVETVRILRLFVFISFNINNNLCYNTCVRCPLEEQNKTAYAILEFESISYM